MKHQYEDYIKWIDERVENRKKRIKLIQEKVTPIYGKNALAGIEERIKFQEFVIASLLANKATLERHKPIQILSDSKHDGGITHRCGGECRGRLGSHKVAPCPSLLDVTNQLDEVMG